MFATVLFGDGGVISVLVARLRFARECFPKIFFGLGAGVFVFALRGGSFYDFFKIGGRVLAQRTNFGRSVAFVHVAANSADPFGFATGFDGGLGLDMRLVEIVSRRRNVGEFFHVDDFSDENRMRIQFDLLNDVRADVGVRALCYG